MPELTAMEKPKVAGFVDRGFNHAKKQKTDGRSRGRDCQTRSRGSW